VRRNDLLVIAAILLAHTYQEPDRVMTAQEENAANQAIWPEVWAVFAIR
jgi:hypothetical protein